MNFRFEVMGYKLQAIAQRTEISMGISKPRTSNNKTELHLIHFLRKPEL